MPTPAFHVFYGNRSVFAAEYRPVNGKRCATVIMYSGTEKDRVTRRAVDAVFDRAQAAIRRRESIPPLATLVTAVTEAVGPGWTVEFLPAEPGKPSAIRVKPV